ncbi:serine/threonine-protein kinase ATG1a [Vicia villosa]|uniref:serine/threonine-protein kinase ATG1a n=1 Tax=Vicia villosa TaxID=3911 RepID=UPI00273B3280|nr:serine/threonine-protein kinase ATG1a [Vicia villosa]
MDLVGPTMNRLVGDYILGPRIGSGSFAVVWRSRHRSSGLEVAIKEIDQTQLSPKVRDNLIKEITILRTIRHPNIIRLFEAIETNDRIYLVLEYCGGGDLAAYIHRYGRVSESIARHFMRQLAAGLQVLQEKNLIHRDLKPQNLLLETTSATPLMKIGDFGFARSLTPLQLADTLCGSPYYMAPEIIQSQKYDAKADLWSVGAILYQLVVGKPPFDGNSQLQLFQNILASTELHFPSNILKDLHPDFVDLCRSLLRRNPDERLTFKAFFNHNFLHDHRSVVNIEQFHSHQSESSIVDQLVGPAFEKVSQAHSEYRVETESAKGSTQTIALNKPGKSIDTVSHLMESIEKGYVLINPHFASLEDFSDYFEASVHDNPSSGVSIRASETTNLEIGKQTTNFSLGNPSNKLELLHQYVQVLGELSQEKYNTGLYLESLTVELVVLAIWKKALDICSTWLAPISKNEFHESSSVNESVIARGDASLSHTTDHKINFNDRPSVSLWAKHEFITAVDRAEKLSCHIQNMDGAVEMPDAIEIIFRQALLIGTNGAVDEYMNNKDKSAASYSKAMLLLSFIVEEAENLPLNPPFSLLADDHKRIVQYIHNLQFRKISLSESSSEEAQ